MAFADMLLVAGQVRNVATLAGILLRQITQLPIGTHLTHEIVLKYLPAALLNSTWQAAGGREITRAARQLAGARVRAFRRLAEPARAQSAHLGQNFIMVPEFLGPLAKARTCNRTIIGC